MEQEHSPSARGKWALKNIPHKGWVCTGIEDLGESCEICEMCEAQEIRYVHYMEHSEYSEVLGVGCVCAEHMEDDYVNPRKRENQLKSASRRRKTWVNRKWKESAKGNFYLNTDGYNITLFENKNGKDRYWSLKIENRETGQHQYSKKKYKDLNHVKMASLDALIWAKDQLK